MPEEIVFSWTGSPRAGSVDPWERKPAWARVVGFGCAALSSTSPPASGPHWVLLEETPRVGSRYPLAVWLPFRGALGEAIWVVYPPPAADPEMAEWCNVPAVLTTGGLARCRLLAVLSHDEPEPHNLPGAWLEVAIEEVIALPDLAARFAPDSTGRPVPPGLAPDDPYTRGCHEGHLHYLVNPDEGDVEDWIVWQRHPGGAAVVLGGERIHDDDIIYAGHRPLDKAELQELEALQAVAEHHEAKARQADIERLRMGTLPPAPSVAVVPEKQRGWRVWERWRSRSPA
jgi:hypothetical protein